MTIDAAPRATTAQNSGIEPQHRAAVDEQQDDDDDDARGDQQVAVEAAERVDERDDQTAGTGAVHTEPGRRIRPRRRDHGLLGVDQVRTLDGLAALSLPTSGTDTAATDPDFEYSGWPTWSAETPLIVRNLATSVVIFCLSCGGEPARTLVDDEARDGLDGAELLLLVRRPWSNRPSRAGTTSCRSSGRRRVCSGRLPPASPMNRMMMASAPKIQTNLGRGCFAAGRRSGCRRWSVLVMHFLLVRRPKLSGTGDIRRWGFTPKRP